MRKQSPSGALLSPRENPVAHNLSFIEIAPNLEVRGSGEDYDNNALNLKKNAKKARQPL